MKIIEHNKAPNPRRVRIFLAEKGLTVPFEQIDIMKLDHRLPGFADKNPMQQVPVLILDDGTAISESVAICRYFEETHPNPPLFGRDAKDKALVEMANRRMELGLLYRVAQAFRHTHPAMAELEKDNGAIYRHLETTGTALMEGIAAIGKKLGLPLHVQGLPTAFHVSFTELPAIKDYRDYALHCDKERYARFVLAMLTRGVRLIERGVWYISAAHTEEQVVKTLSAVTEALQEVG